MKNYPINITPSLMKTKYTKIKKLWKDLKNHQNKAIDTQFSKIALQLIVHLELFRSTFLNAPKTILTEIRIGYIL